MNELKMGDQSSVLVFFVNGKKIIDENVNPEWTLLYYLRDKLLLCGTKLGCGEGGCGACTVMISKYDRQLEKIIHYPINACLAPVCSMHGLAVTTVEGIGSTKAKLHPVQERIAKAHGSQCGFCTPGIVMSMYTLLRNTNRPRMAELDETFQGNLCRCTGYRPILDGYKTFTEEWELMQLSNGITNGCGMGDQCCKKQNGSIPIDSEVLFDASKFIPYDPSQEPIFPPELKLNDCYDKQSLMFTSRNVTWYRPVTLEALLKLKAEYPHAKLVVGNTETGVEVKFKNQLYPVIIQPSRVEELTHIKLTTQGMIIGAGVTLSQLETMLKLLVKTKPSEMIASSILEMLQQFAGKQIRSVASIGGNIMTGSPISDLNPIWMAARAKLTLRSHTTERLVPMDQHFYKGYRKTSLEPKEILLSITVPYTANHQYFFAHKQARRREDDIAIVNSAMSFFINPKTHQIDDIELCFGGMAPTTVLAIKSRQLIGMKIDEEMLQHAYKYLSEDLPLSEDAPGGMINFRRVLPMSFFFRSYLNIRNHLRLDINPKDVSALKTFDYLPPKGSQYYQSEENGSLTDTVGRPIPHTNAFHQASGEAVYVDDMPKFEKELHMALVYSQKAHARIKSINIDVALEKPNVVDYILAADIPTGKNINGMFQDEQLIVTDKVTSQYQILGAILATDQLSAQQAAKSVKVVYEEELPVIVTIDQAIQADSLFPGVVQLSCGNTKDAFNQVQHIVTGEARTGYQEHFYMEPHAYLVIPREGQELEVYCATQDHNGMAQMLSQLLEIDQNKITVKVKRIGGAFGGKEVCGRKYTAMVALAAKKTSRPVRFVLERDEDMGGTGGRNPFLVKYKLGFNADGRILAGDIEIFANAGYSQDMSLWVVRHGMAHITNSVYMPNVKAVGRACKTNLPTNTSFRGFGIPQANYAAECMLRHVAEYLGRDYVELARMNFYSEGDLTPYNQPIIGCNIRRCFEECLINSDFVKRKQEVEQFNKENRWKKRGIDVVTTTYGIGFGMNIIQQAGALVLIYLDGSVLLTHGGVEMGQGLHTKMIQVASKALNIPMEKIHTTDAATDKVPNVSPTAGSMSSDLNGMAIINACEKLNKRLEPIKEKNPTSTWEQWIKTAYAQRISLSATGFYREPEINWDWETGSGNKLHNYFSFGAACTEVEIDCLTGDHRVLRTDIVMDVGNSLNPAVDIGQIEGGFVQGYGMFVMEEMVVLPDGTYMCKGPGAYKIPGFNDIPVEFNVALLKDSPNTKAVYSSKAIGEPPLFLASSAFFAIREACKAARRDAGVEENFVMHSPATPDKIRLACQDHFTKQVNDTKSTWRIDCL